METEVNLIETLASFVAYWSHFDIACPQMTPKGLCKPNASQETIEVNAFVMVLKLPPSSFTYAMIQTLNPYFASTSLIYKAMAFPKMFTVSKKPNQLLYDKAPISFTRFKIITKVFILTFDIKRSNDSIVQEWDDFKVDNINLSLFYSTTLDKISFTKAHFDAKTRQGFYLIISLLKNKTSTNENGTNSLDMNKAKFSSNCFWLWLSLL